MKFSFTLSLIAALSLFASCNGGNASSSSASSLPGAEDVPMRHSRLLRMAEHDGITEATIVNPWDSTGILHKYWLVPDTKTLSEVPADISVIKTPVASSMIFSGVHAALINELGHGNDIKGMCDLNYVSDPDLKRLIQSGSIADCGTVTSPNMERLVSIRPGAILLSTYEGSTVPDQLSTLGIPVVDCADYMEPTPLARAEWIKFYGRLYGEGEKADSLFNSIEQRYLKLKNSVNHSSVRPSVLFDRIYGNAWYVPEKYSTTARFVTDAGGRNPFDYLNESGSVPLSSEEVLVRAGNADFWLIRHSGEDLSYKSLSSDNPVYAKFKAFKEKNILTCNTTETGVFDQAAFHPDRLLEELVAILHPEVSDSSYQKKFYIPLE